MIKLKEIATINTGLVLSRKRAKKEDEIVKKYHLITLKSFNITGSINSAELDMFKSIEVLPGNYITKSDDIIIRLSEPNTAIYIDKDSEGLLIQSQFCLIRLSSKTVLPEYLAWYLNSRHIKKEINKSLIGSALAIIKTSFLNELKIVETSIEKQRKIIELHKLKRKERELLSSLLTEKDKLYNNMIEKIFNANEEIGWKLNKKKSTV